jgi:hypothetical protein
MMKFGPNQYLLDLRDILGKLEAWPLCSISLGNSLFFIQILKKIELNKYLLDWRDIGAVIKVCPCVAQSLDNSLFFLSCLSIFH